ncbi:hypothetical protein PIB30_010701 [Stylosanthes scabra]|uniref:Protein kinase domain-containing protein n=1 Tax=Stylosanthes scabra TaxID=79078 RepID=A0ABU6W507_9FABA|nr:hypothetical protein [Stylosanthes scabra]
MADLISQLKSIGALALFLVCVYSSNNSISVDEATYMLELRNAVTPTPSNWIINKKTTICMWHGVNCSSHADGSSYIQSIHLSLMKLTGTLPSGLNNSLSFLQSLDVQGNTLTGPIPSFANLNNLQHLHLGLNNFTSIPQDSFQNLSNLLSFTFCCNNNLAPWTFPTDLIHSSRLNIIFLPNSNLVGSLPDIFGSFPNLQVLKLQRNRLTGVVPTSLVYLSRLQNISLEENLLQGPYPVFIRSTVRQLISLAGNGFCLNHDGPCDQRVTTLLQVAEAFGYPYVLASSWQGNNPCNGWNFIACDDGGSKITSVNLTKLNLTGTISASFGNLSDLRELYLGGNNLSGSIPDSLASLSQLTVVDVSNNNLSGSFPIFSHNIALSCMGNAFLTCSQPNNANGLSPSSIAGITLGGSAVIVIVAMIVYDHKRCFNFVQRMILLNKKTSSSDNRNVEDLIKSYGALTPTRYTYAEVKRMTNSFNEKLGEGGYGVVYKASLINGQQLAVKILKELKGSGEEFVNEVVTIIRTSHVNVVSLFGFCYERNKRALIYDFMSNGSLDKFIYSSNAIHNLEWNTLYQIIIGIARGLEYLHQGCNTKILHLDIKPQNILLDDKFCPKIADFGLAKICKRDKSVASILGTRGTPGYIAPEMFNRTYGGVSHKSDVYSYGMLILEMIGKRKNGYSGESHSSEVLYFPEWIYKEIEQGSIRRGYMSNIKEENEMIRKVTLVSLWCIQTNPLERPSMRKVLDLMEGPLQAVPHPPKPTLYSPKRPSAEFSDASRSNASETNSITTEENGFANKMSSRYINIEAEFGWKMHVTRNSY